MYPPAASQSKRGFASHLILAFSNHSDDIIEDSTLYPHRQVLLQRSLPTVRLVLPLQPCTRQEDQHLVLTFGWHTQLPAASYKLCWVAQVLPSRQVSSRSSDMHLCR